MITPQTVNQFGRVRALKTWRDGPKTSTMTDSWKKGKTYLVAIDSDGLYVTSDGLMKENEVDPLEISKTMLWLTPEEGRYFEPVAEVVSGVSAGDEKA